MRKSHLAITVLMLMAMAAPAAGQSSLPKSEQATPKQLPLKRATSDKSCAAYGAGFVKIEGSDTCVKIGGAISIGAGTSTGSR